MIHTGNIEKNGESSICQISHLLLFLIVYFLRDNQNYSLPTQLVCSSKNELLHAKQLLTL